jgi:hypothetical protein
MGLPDYWPDTGWKEGLEEYDRSTHMSALDPRAEYYNVYPLDGLLFSRGVECLPLYEPPKDKNKVRR